MLQGGMAQIHTHINRQTLQVSYYFDSQLLWLLLSTLYIGYLILSPRLAHYGKYKSKVKYEKNYETLIQILDTR